MNIDQRVYCCLCFEQVTLETGWKDERGQAWDICVPCKLAEQREEIRRNLVDWPRFEMYAL